MQWSHRGVEENVKKGSTKNEGLVVPIQLCSADGDCRFLGSYRGGSRISFRRGCTLLLLHFNTNKSHSFFFLAEYQLY